MNKAILAVMASAMAAALARPAVAQEEQAIFAGGCFWCMESDFEAVPGVTSVVSGYTGGELENPTYKNHAGHVEAVRIVYDSAEVSYRELLHTFWRSVDPTDDAGQFCDRGHSYTTAIFVLDEEQHAAANASKTDIESRLSSSVATPIQQAGNFTVAEEYHQDYYKKNPVRYNYYRKSCGRDARIKKIWGSEAHAGIQKNRK